MEMSFEQLAYMHIAGLDPGICEGVVLTMDRLCIQRIAVAYIPVQGCQSVNLLKHCLTLDTGPFHVGSVCLPLPVVYLESL